MSADPRVEVVERSGDTVVARVAVVADDPVFAGHFPGLPVLPGLSVVALVDRVAAVPGRRLAGIESARFARPVFPGAELTVRLTREAGRCTAVVSDAEGVVARVKLRYEEVAS